MSTVLKLAILIFVPLGILWIPSSIFNEGPTLCLIKNMFNIECPTCGLTRATFAVVDGNFDKAFRLNKFVIILILVVPLVWIYLMVKTLTGLPRILNTIRFSKNHFDFR